MAIKDIFKMIKADRYTSDGREELIKAQEAVTEDVTYKPGDISRKTGLQKQPDGSWKPVKNAPAQSKKQAAGTGLKPGALEEMAKEVDSPEARQNYDDFMKAYKERERREISGDPAPSASGSASTATPKLMQSLGLNESQGSALSENVTKMSDLVAQKSRPESAPSGRQPTPEMLEREKMRQSPEAKARRDKLDAEHPRTETGAPMTPKLGLKKGDTAYTKYGERTEILEVDGDRVLAKLNGHTEWHKERAFEGKLENKPAPSASGALKEQTPEEIREIGRAGRAWRESLKKDAEERQTEVQKALAEQMKKEANSSDIKIRGMDKDKYIFNTMMERHIPREKAEESWNQEVERVQKLRAESSAPSESAPKAPKPSAPAISTKNDKINALSNYMHMMYKSVPVSAWGKEYGELSDDELEERFKEFASTHTPEKWLNRYENPSQDSAPRILTGDCKVRIRKSK